MFVLLDSYRQALQRLGQAVGHLLYPPLCLHCGERPESTTFPLCLACQQLLRRVPEGEALRRLHQFPAALGCFRAAYALWYYQPAQPLERLHHALKYGNRPTYGRFLGQIMGETFRTALQEAVDLILPIPLHRRRYLERGYNQSAWLAYGVGEVLGLPVMPELLQRVRATRSQTHLNRSARQANVAGAFRAPMPELLRSRHILLVDDLLTTGATATAAAHALHAARVASITLLTLGLAD
jgi:ComF family protein